MCVICYFPPKSMPTEDQIFNAVHNNEHGCGIVIQKANQPLEIIKEIFIDPDKIYEILDNNRMHSRYLHVRNNTAGKTSIENVHPFEVLKTEEREVLFMHNGTLNKYKPTTTTTYTYHGGRGQVAEKNESPDADLSDTAIYVRDFLKPLLSNWSDPTFGRGWIENDFLKKILDDSFDYSSKGIVIATDCAPLFINKGWMKHVTQGNNIEWFASNNTYFDRLQRGTLFEQRKKEEEAKKQAETANKNPPSNVTPLRPVVPLKEVGFGIGESKELLEAFNTIWTNHDIWSDYGLADLSLLSMDEVDYLFAEHSSEGIALFCYVTIRFKELLEEYNKSQDKNYKATQNIATFRQEIEDLKKKLKDKEEVHVG